MSAKLDYFGTAPMRSTLESAALPRRVHGALEHLYALLSDELERQLERMLSDFEQQLFRLAEQARNAGEQSRHFETLRRIRQNRSDLVPRYLAALEHELTRIRGPMSAPAVEVHGLAPAFETLRLVDEAEVTQEAMVQAVASRHEARAGLPLMLLGQRFGVLAGAPAFDAEHLPVGPHALGRLLAEAASVLNIDAHSMQLLFKSFDSQVMSGYAQLVETMNALLARDNILPSLSYVPLRVRPTAQSTGRDGAATKADRSTGSAGEEGGPATARSRNGPRPHTAWYGEADAVRGEDEDIAFSLLQDLLGSRRDLLGKLKSEPQGERRTALPTPDVVAALESQQAAVPARKPGGQRTSLADIKQTLLAQSRQQHGRAATLSREDNDTFELLGMLYAEIGRELRAGSASNEMLEKLQVPLARAALQDRAFFVHSQHPARQLLNSVAEAGATWLDEDEVDPQLEAHLGQAVDHVVENYRGDPSVFQAANERLQGHLQALARKAEVTERRHVEAARGKEKLAVAKRRSGEIIDEAMREQRLPKFVRTLLAQAWSDVLTLTLLRNGEDSDEWHSNRKATDEIVAASSGAAPAPADLEQRIEHALALVGYHADEAGAIARRLTQGRDEDDDDPASRTELAMKLKARTRLGEDTDSGKSKATPRTPDEQARYDYLRTLPFGTWLEIATNQQGDVVRRRLAWFSPVTGHALLVNQRGQRVGEESLDHLARLMAKREVRVVTAERGRIVDRAWQAALGALRSFAGIGERAPREATP
ncbi:DUF1631 family protein [Lysobacter sp. A3-1-A15]|uniref:DUF1631 family protein n=1 Tax=Novilysobacter viscosus TaxID=3098602 RepID=UPI002EDA4D94